MAAEPGRPNLVARLRGDTSGPTLCLLGHADTVPADPSEWSFDPWAGDIVDGEVRGRGRQDMKGQVAAEVAAAAALGAASMRGGRIAFAVFKSSVSSREVSSSATHRSGCR